MNNEEQQINGFAGQQYGYDQNYAGQQYGYDQNYGGNGIDQQSFGVDVSYNQNQGYAQPAMNTQTFGKETVSSNVVTGIVGAFLGSLVGVAMWVIVYKLGYIAGMSGAVMVICAMMGYKKFGKCLDIKGIIICVVLCIGMIYISQRLSVSLQLYKEFSDYGYDMAFSDCYKEMFDILDVVDQKSTFWGDLAIGYLLFVIASVSYVISSIKNRAK